MGLEQTGIFMNSTIAVDYVVMLSTGTQAILQQLITKEHKSCTVVYRGFIYPNQRERQGLVYSSFAR